MPDLSLERACATGPVAGVDEAGRGSWAGPVVAAAVILPADGETEPALAGIDDSKALSRTRREACLAALQGLADAGRATIGVGMASVAEIDETNILAATMAAMTRAVVSLAITPALVLVDGNRLPELAMPARVIVGGDACALSIAAASIVAKVTRDRLMTELAGEWSGYGWERNAGYGTVEHRAGLAAIGVTPNHRRSFAPIRALLKSA